jgi:hypothetical protein
MLKRVVDQTLSVRFQFRENVAIMQTFVPGVAFYGIAISIGIPLAVYSQFWLLNAGYRGDSPIILMINQILLIIWDLYCVVFVVWVMLRYSPMLNLIRADAQNCFGVRLTLTDVASMAYVRNSTDLESFTHFKQLNESWESALEKRRSRISII